MKKSFKLIFLIIGIFLIVPTPVLAHHSNNSTHHSTTNSNHNRCSICGQNIGTTPHNHNENKCSICGQNIGSTPHNHNENKCSICGLNIGSTPHNHNENKCSICGQNIGTTPHNHNENKCSICGLNIGTTPHNHNENKCSICGQNIGSTPHNHNENKCSICGQNIGTTPHNHNENKCSICGLNIGSTPHNHNNITPQIQTFNSNITNTKTVEDTNIQTDIQKLSNNTNLKVMIDNKEINFQNAKATYNVSKNSKKLNYDYILEDSNASIRVEEKYGFNSDINMLIFNVTAPDGTNKVYEVSINEISENTKISYAALALVPNIGIGYGIYHFLKKLKK